MKFKKTLALALSALMLMSSAVVATSAATDDSEAVGAYSNQTFLETEANNAYNEQNLGATYSAASTTFKMWSPKASSVKVKLYKTGSDKESGAGKIGEYAMTKNSTTGVWSYTLSGDHKNQYYTYLVTVNGTTNETQDIYSKAVGVNGKRSMIVDLDSTDPDGWSTDKHVLLNSAQEAVVWEVHVRDFSIAENSGVSEDNKGGYLAFTEGGTKLNGAANGISTCVDYLVEQGINCVQLQPVYDFGSVDEEAGASSTNRNWGYDPVNYNVPEGSYSTNAFDGNVRIKEFKQMVQALHDRGISVVMDVVYNHTFDKNSCFTKSVPGYYYRMKSADVYSNGSGCGNETASDKKMFRKYMIESCRYWVDEYHIDGFRYDLMGLHDVDTMNQIRNNLDQVSSKILMYGEPWAAEWNGSECGLCPKSSTSGRITQLNSRVGMFNDKYRDAIKGDTDGAVKGFVQGNTSANTAKIVSGVKGKNFSAQSPAQTIAYADAHDNLILWDKILKSNGSSSYTAINESTTEKYRAQVREVMTLLMTSQGIPFMTAGSEFGRTKKGNANSYNANDSINQIDWSRVSSFSNLAQYYKGLLQIRKNYAPLKGAGFATPTFQSDKDDVVAYTYSNSTSGQWGKLCVLVNGSDKNSWPINLNGSGWTIVAKDKQAGLTSLGTVSGSSYTIPARSSAILVESSTFNRLNVTEKFGTLTVNHVDDKGNVLKTSTSKYRAGNTYRALPDTTLLFDYNLKSTEGATTGTVAADTNYTVTFTYSNSGIVSGYVTVNYVDSTGTAIKDSSKQKLRAGDTYDVPVPAIQGYELDTDSFPANIKGTFTGEPVNITFKFKKLSPSTTKVHYYKTYSNWSDVRLYAYTEDGTKVNGEWTAAPVMTSEGNNWYVGTAKAPAAYVMFHPTTAPSSGADQEPGQNEQGYFAAGEVWIEGGTVTFNSKMIVSHIDLKTGQKIAEDVVTEQTKTKSTTAYTTTPLSGRTDVITPANASGNYQPGTFNVVYLYGDPDTPLPTVEPTTADPDASTEPTTEPKPTTPDPGKRILVGDVNFDGIISVADATLVQQAAAEMVDLDKYETIAADCNGDGIVSVADATLIQKYAAEFDEDLMLTGTYVGTDGPTEPQPSTAQPTDPEPTEPEPTEPESTEYEEHSFLLTDNFSWGTAYVYAWDANGDPIGGEWPGSNMAEKQTNDYGETQFIIHVPAGAAGIVVHNGNGAQTADITDFSVSGYWMDGTKDSLGHYKVTGWN